MSSSTDTAKGLEVHEHASLRRSGSIFHSHVGGDQPHQHADTGPACYTIDKDEWFLATGFHGGGKKRFTKKPEGHQFAIVELEPWQKSFEVIICAPPEGHQTAGAGELPALRMMKAFRMAASVIDGSCTGGRR
jgi:hypothetical protein